VYASTPSRHSRAARSLATLNKGDLEELVGTVPRDLMDEVGVGIRWFLNLE
jgi:hypothetical protein